MEEQIAELAAKLAELEAATAGAAITNTMFAETFYYLTIPLMINCRVPPPAIGVVFVQ